MGANQMDVIRWGNEQVRVRPWQGRGEVAELVPFRQSLPLSVGFVRRAKEELSSKGFTRVRTNGLLPAEQGEFLAAGFRPAERLHLLRLDLRHDSYRPTKDRRRPLRRAGRADRAAVLGVDHEAFDPIWRLGPAGLEETLSATPRSRLRVGCTDGRVAAYAVTGRCGLQGYLQRVAVRPPDQGCGLGRALVLDGVAWLRQWRVRHVLVNTPTANGPALALYEGLGFRRQPDELTVLTTELSG